MQKRLTMLLVLAGVFLAILAIGERPKQQNSFALRTAAGIVPAHHNGRWELVYELHMVNCAKSDLILDRVELFEVQSGKLRARLDDALTSAIGRLDRQTTPGGERRIPPGVEAIVYMTVEWPEQTERRVTLKHRVSYSADSGNLSNATIEGGEFLVLA